MKNVKKPVTVITPLRKGGLGIAGTYRNADHHANAVIPFLKVLEVVLPTIGFKEWHQGHNVHEFVTLDDRKFTLRAYTRDREYRGIRLSLRISRSCEILLMDAETQEQLDVLISSLRKLSRPARGDLTPLIDKSSYYTEEI